MILQHAQRAFQDSAQPGADHTRFCTLRHHIICYRHFHRKPATCQKRILLSVVNGVEFKDFNSHNQQINTHYGKISFHQIAILVFLSERYLLLLNFQTPAHCHKVTMSDNAQFITKDFAAGETLFSQGDVGDFIFIIINGTVDVCKTSNDKKEIVARMSSGDILGEMAVLTDTPRCASGIAAEPTRVIMVKDRTLRLALLNNDLPILKPLFSQLILRFKEAEQQANYYRRKFKKLEKEVAVLKENLLQHEISADN